MACGQIKLRLIFLWLVGENKKEPININTILQSMARWRWLNCNVNNGMKVEGRKTIWPEKKCNAWLKRSFRYLPTYLSLFLTHKMYPHSLSLSPGSFLLNNSHYSRLLFDFLKAASGLKNVSVSSGSKYLIGHKFYFDSLRLLKGFLQWLQSYED